MAEGEFYEKLSIRDSVKSLKKYGSTSKHLKRPEHFVKHTIESTDTLQGIALKYGVTTEQIRRTNRLWATDSLFLREFLMIPIPSDCPFTSTENVHLNNNTSKPMSPTSPVTSIEVDEPSIDSFLSNIDSSIAIMKKEVRKAQGASEFVKENEYISSKQKKHAVSRMRQYANSSQLNDGTTTSYQNQHIVQPHTVPMVITQSGRKVKTSLQRLEQQQDEMFEL